MVTGAVLAALAAAAVLAVAAWAAAARRGRALAERFGPEYDRAVRAGGGERAARRELARRRRRRAGIEVRPLTAERRAAHAEAWAVIQRDFVDDPSAAVRAAHRLVEKAATERGYPDGERREDDLSVDHPHEIGGYRRACGTARRDREGGAGTEELREAMVGFRGLLAGLLGGTGPAPGRPGGGGAPPPRGADGTGLRGAADGPPPRAADGAGGAGEEGTR
ncbi:hypothetical protein [Nocardiopsis potens]|uniref:hypothetical protein n=1 Tax=Nocardiopsis potens TaxID=1246458 RepID=UPI00034746C9|nr:hypothetical protein [Nocardiopsis potens]